MKKTLGNLFKTKSEPVEEAKAHKSLSETSEEVSLTYKQSGFADSQNAAGNFINFGQELERIYERFLKQCREDAKLQEELRTPHIAKLEKCKSELNKLETLLKIKKDDLDDVDAEVDKCCQKIERIKQNPKGEGVPADPKPEVQFYLGLFLLLPITLYLVVFYISASYSAFFREFGADASVTDAIFDANALTKAWQDGWLEFVFVLTIPFAFMGLGYLIHMFQKTTSKIKYYKIAALVVVTFIFDAILAYLIDGHIFKVNSILGEKYDLGDAVVSTSFWGIIFAGFVVYMIWGLVLDFVLKEHENKDKVKLAIAAEEQKISRFQEKKDVLKSEVEDLNSKILSCKNDIIEEQSSIDSIMIPVRQYLAYHSEYASGWLSYIAGHLALTEERQHKLLQACRNVSEKFIDEKELKVDSAKTIKLDVA